MAAGPHERTLAQFLQHVKREIQKKLAPIMFRLRNQAAELERWRLAAHNACVALDEVQRQRLRERSDAVAALAAHSATIARLESDNERLRQEIDFERRITESELGEARSNCICSTNRNAGNIAQQQDGYMAQMASAARPSGSGCNSPKESGASPPGPVADDSASRLREDSPPRLSLLGVGRAVTPGSVGHAASARTLATHAPDSGLPGANPVTNPPHCDETCGEEGFDAVVPGTPYGPRRRSLSGNPFDLGDLT